MSAALPDPSTFPERRHCLLNQPDRSCLQARSCARTPGGAAGLTRTRLCAHPAFPHSRIDFCHGMVDCPKGIDSPHKAGSEMLPVFRRLIALLIVSVGLLSTALPAIACELAARQGDCCPADAPSPCARVELAIALRPAFADCCVVNRPSAPSIVPVSGGNEPERAHRSGSPDPLVTSLRLAAAQRPESAHSIAPALSHSPRNDASSTYLLTGRLRL